MLHRYRMSVALTATLLFSTVVYSESSFADDSGYGPIRVMTQNLYLGADLLRIVNEPNPQLIPVRVAETLAVINATDFHTRAQKIADEVKDARPDVIGLQEVTLLRTQFPGDVLLGNPVAATEILYDYLDLLRGALTKHGLHYDVAAVVQNADVEVPALVGFDPSGQPMLMDVRLTDHDVILVRRGVKTWNPQAQNYYVNLQVPLGGTMVEFTRGFASVDVNVRDQVYRIVNTHLELPGPLPMSLVQTLQAQELITKLAFSPLNVVLVGDFNSSPQDPVDPVTGVPPYLQLVAGNFIDTWLQRRGSPSAGYTCCQNERVNNAVSLLNMRIDHIFLRDPSGDATFLDDARVTAWTVGDAPVDKTRSGLWPSDHAGVVATVKFWKDGDAAR